LKIVQRRVSAVKNSRKRVYIVKSVLKINLFVMGKNKRLNVVYSTNPDFSYDEELDNEIETLEPNQQNLYVSIDRKQRGGKEVTLVEGFVGSVDDLKDLGKMLRVWQTVQLVGFGILFLTVFMVLMAGLQH